MTEIKETIKKIFACFLGLTPILGTIYIIGRIRREKRWEETGWIDAYPSLKEGILPFLKFYLPILIVIFLLFRSFGFGIDPLLIFLYPDIFYPILIKILLLKFFIENFVKISFFMLAIDGRKFQDIVNILLDVRRVLVILGISIVSSVSSIFLGEYSIFLDWKFLTSLFYMFFVIK